MFRGRLPPRFCLLFYLYYCNTLPWARMSGTDDRCHAWSQRAERLKQQKRALINVDTVAPKAWDVPAG
jgi:hypothetical protein